MSLMLTPQLDRDLTFHLQFSSFTPYDLFLEKEGMWNGKRGSSKLYSSSISAEVAAWEKKLNLEDVRLLYLYGVGLGHYLPALEKWLQKDPSHTVVILEDDLGALEAFLKVHAKKNSHPQIHLKYLSTPGVLEECAHLFGEEQVKIEALLSYKRRKTKTFNTLQTTLTRKTILWNAVKREGLESPFLTERVLSNAQHLPRAFYVNKWKGAFTSVPAVICGSGPSLQTIQHELHGIKEKALLLAGGSALTALSQLGETPHLGLALDPNDHEYDLLSRCAHRETPFLFSSRLCPAVVPLFQGPIGYIRTETGGACEAFIEKAFGLKDPPVGPDMGQEALSVTTVLISLAHFLGCSPIILVGVDLAYTNNLLYSSGVAEKNNLQKRSISHLRSQKDVHGKKIYTHIKWLMEKETLENYVKNHPETVFLRGTAAGLPLEGVPFQPLTSLLSAPSLPLTTRVREEIEKSRFYFPPHILHEIFPKLEESLQESIALIDTIVHEISCGRPESGRRVLAEFDLKEQLAFEPFFKAPLFAHALQGQSSEKKIWEHVREVALQSLCQIPICR